MDDLARLSFKKETLVLSVREQTVCSKDFLFIGLLSYLNVTVLHMQYETTSYMTNM